MPAVQGRPPTVLVITGGLLNEKESSPWRALRKQAAQWRASESAWLDLKSKAIIGESIVLAGWHRLVSGRHLATDVREYLSRTENLDVPELTEVVLTTLLRAEAIPYEIATIDDVFRDDRPMRARLASCSLVFLSTTLLRDLGEVEPILQRIVRPHHRIVLGGALASILAEGGDGIPKVDVLAVGYGETLVPILASYLRSGFQTLSAPPPASIDRRRHSIILRSGVPATRSLDALATPDWLGAARDHRCHFPLVHYESVRGCPYRCNFCNYPYLFDDEKFRYKSARKIADDWQRYRDELGVEFISCLDSLFTLPRRRLSALCEELVRRRIEVKWICYARASDLADRDVAAMMRDAGAHQVQIGIESGDPQVLANMNKQCSVEENAKALDNCRSVGLTSVVSLVVGFPGENEASLATTYRFLHDHPPDFHFLAIFSTRVAGVPVLNDVNRARFELQVDSNPRTVAPYWRHSSMSSADVGRHVRRLNRALIENRVSLNAATFYAGLLRYSAAQRDALLDFQRASVNDHRLLGRGFDLLHGWIDRRLAEDMARRKAIFASDSVNDPGWQSIRWRKR
ncbi:MAG: radical SAM protein [Candidatus Accumulibacter phosphatis]|nr:radical SAM protein [Candidatus Accumulibacter phosphatis]